MEKDIIEKKKGSKKQAVRATERERCWGFTGWCSRVRKVWAHKLE